MPPLRTVVLSFALAIVYAASGVIGFHIGFAHHIATSVWIPSGIALAALFWGGLRLWPGVALGAVAFNLWIGSPPLAIPFIMLGNTLEIVIASTILSRLQFNPLLERRRDGVVFICAALASPIVAALIGSLAFAVAEQLDVPSLVRMGAIWWLGDSLSLLVLGSFLIRWPARPLFRPEKKFRDHLEQVSFLVITILAALLIFTFPLPGYPSLSVAYLLLVPLSWGSMRAGPRYVTAALLAVSGIAVFGLFLGEGPYATFAGLPEILLTQAYIATLAVMCIVLASSADERKRALMALRENVQGLSKDVQAISHADRTKTEFIGTLSHELRNPLAAVVSTLDLFAMKYRDTVDQEMIHRATHNVRFITRLLDDLLDVTRITRNKLVLSYERVSVAECVRRVIDTLREPAQRKHHTLRTELLIDATLNADPVRIEQVLVNLVTNAIKYTPPGGTITVSSDVKDEYAFIRVTDTGLGIPKADQERIFQPFTQLDTQARSGLGIGLSISRRIVDLHGGKLSVESTPGRGTTFTVQLPVHIERPRRSIVIVGSSGNELATILNRVGHSAVCVTPDTLLKERRHADAILCIVRDIPGLGALIHALKSATRASLVALIHSDEERTHAEAAGLTECIPMPPRVSDIERLLGVRSS